MELAERFLDALRTRRWSTEGSLAREFGVSQSESEDCLFELVRAGLVDWFGAEDDGSTPLRYRIVKPVRVKRSRAKGSRLTAPNALPIVVVSRPGKWGNPHVVQPVPNRGRYRPGGREAEHRKRAYQCVEMFRSDLLKGRLRVSVEDVRRELRGKNLACWCALDGVCHADVLLEVANG